MKRIVPLASCVAFVVVASCGARTGLFAPEDDTAGAAHDASLDAPSRGGRGRARATARSCCSARRAPSSEGAPPARSSRASPAATATLETTKGATEARERPGETPGRRGIDDELFAGAAVCHGPRRRAPVAQRIEQRFPNSPPADAPKAHETPEKQARNASGDHSETVAKSDRSPPSATLENKGRTLWDETISALTRALDRATTSEERLAILAELRAWREGRA